MLAGRILLCDDAVVSSHLKVNKMPRIFISYRRADSQTITGRMYDRLVSEFGQHNVFKDVHDIHLGDDWREVLSQQVIESDVVLAVIGAKWLTITDAEGKRRLDNVDDYVRLEVVSGLKNKSGLVIPVLVDGMLLPKEEHLPDDLSDLVYRQFIQIREDPDFHNDMTRLIRASFRAIWLLFDQFGNDSWHVHYCDCGCRSLFIRPKQQSIL